MTDDRTDDRVEEVKKNLLSPSQWSRILYMAFYAIACWVLIIVIPVIVACQVIISLLSGNNNADLRDLGAKLSAYFHSALDYLLYVTEDKPWPFGQDHEFHSDNDSSFRPASSPADDAEEFSESAQSPASEGTATDEDVFADISFTESHGDHTAESGSGENDDNGEADANIASAAASDDENTEDKKDQS